MPPWLVSFTLIEEDSLMSALSRWLIASSVVAAGALAPTVVAGADAWKIDGAHSSAQFSVTHYMISTVRGQFNTMSGTLEYDGKSAESIKADVTIDATSINTHDDKRDGHLKSPDFFDVAKVPTLTFKSKKVVPGAGGAFKLVGDLTMHGVTKEVTLDVTAPSKVIKGMRGESRVAASATATINRQDFGVKWNANLDGGGVVVSNDVAIQLDIEAMLPPPAAPAPPPAKP
jgi:polyisoprenoid-binding protein YceI